MSRGGSGNADAARGRWFASGVLLVVLVAKAWTWPWAGALTTPDSLAYFRAAAELAMRGSPGQDFLHWPPLYPALLALAGFLAPSAAAAASGLNAMALLLLLAGCWRIAMMLGCIPGPSALWVAVVALSAPVELVFRFAWSEPVFMVFCLGCLWAWGRCLSRRQTRDLSVAAIMLALALLTRHVGVALVAVLAPSLCLAPRSPRPDRWRRPTLGLVLLAGVLPYGLWLARTWLLSGTLTGPRPAAGHRHLGEALLQYAQVLAHWVWPHAYFADAPGWALALTGVVLLAVFAVGGIAIDRWRKGMPAVPLGDASPMPAAGVAPEDVFATLSTGFVVAYSALLVASASAVRFDALGDRLMAPLAVFLASVLLMGLRDLQGVVKRRSPMLGRGVEWLGVIGLVLWLGAPNSLTELVLALA